MRSLLVLAASVTPLLSVVAWHAMPGQADSRNFKLAELPPLPSIDEVADISEEPAFWFRLRQRTSLFRLAASLDFDSEQLAEINDQPENHVFRSGSWFAIPAELRDRAEILFAVEADSVRTEPPITAPPPVQSTASVQRGDSLATFLERHGINKEELKRFNPGLKLSELSAGNTVQVAKAKPGQQLMAIRPSVSGGASWPIRPDLSQLQSTNWPSLQLSPSTTYRWPTKGTFTSGYGWRWGRMHKGIDIANSTGTSVYSARDGIVTFAGWSGAYGYLVEIAHGDGESTRYAHNSRLIVSKGQVVPQGAPIALMGSTGRSTGPHLHFEIRRSGGAAVNPLSKLPQRRA